MTIKEAARLLGDITEREVYNRIEARDLETVHLGRRHLIYLPSLDAYVEQLLAKERATRASAA